MRLAKLLFLWMTALTGCRDYRSTTDEFNLLADIPDIKNSSVTFDSSMDVSLDLPIGMWQQSYFLYTASLVIEKHGVLVSRSRMSSRNLYARPMDKSKWTIYFKQF